MRLKRGFFVFGCTIFLISLCMGFYQNEANAETIKLSLASFVPPKHCINTTAREWADEVTKRTGGKVEITIYPSQSLLSAKKTYEGVLSGAADIGTSCFTYNSGSFPVMMILDTALGIPSATVGGKVAHALYDKYKPKELSKIKVLYLYTCSPVGIAFGKPVRTIDEIKGTVIRAPGGQAPYMKAFGASVVALPMSEALMSIRKGMVDGCTADLTVFRPMKIGEVAKYVLMTEHSVTSFWMGMNLKKWNSLPPDIQKTIDEVNAEWVERAGSNWDKAAADGGKYMSDVGGEVIRLSESDLALKKKLLSGIVDEYVGQLEKDGYPGKQILKDAQQFIEQYK